LAASSLSSTLVEGVAPPHQAAYEKGCSNASRARALVDFEPELVAVLRVRQRDHHASVDRIPKRDPAQRVPSRWGLHPGLDWLQTLMKAGTVALAIALALTPRERDLRQLAARPPY
jgi:uncharacterized protein (DUF1501 family)